MTYIHNNPVRAGICEWATQYRYSSIHEFLTKGSVPSVRKMQDLLCFPELSSMLDMEKELQEEAAQNRKTKSMMLLGLSQMDICEIVQENIGACGKSNLRDELAQYIRDGKSPFCQFLKGRLLLESAEEKDTTIVRTLLDLTGTNSITEFQQLDKRSMRGALAMVRDSGVSIRHLNRLTGISFSIIRTSYTDAVERKVVAEPTIKDTEQ